MTASRGRCAVPAVALTAHGQPDGIARGRAAGIDFDARPTELVDFVVLLPAVAKHAGLRARESSSIHCGRGNQMASVMIIGDGLVGAAAEGAVAALRQLGHDVATVGTALAAAALTVRRPDVVVLQGPMSLPDGLMALQALRSRAGLAALAAILVSTDPTPEQVARGGRWGAWRMIDRADYRPTTLAAAVEELTRAS